MIYIIDENVPMTANDVDRTPPLTPQADNACKIACIDKLQEILANGIVALDDAGEILERYRGKLNHKGMPGVGDAFLRHVSDRQGDAAHVLKYTLPKNHTGEYDDFPTDVALATFDHNDRIFVSLTKVAGNDAVLLNAVDSDYKHFAVPLANADIVVQELCPHCLKEEQA